MLAAARFLKAAKKKERTGTKKFKTYPIGYFHLDIAEVQAEEGKLHLFVGIHRTSKFAYAQLHAKANHATAKSFLAQLIASVPNKIHTILTDNAIRFTHRSREVMPFMTPFGRMCREHGIEHRLSRVKHPWTNGQVERMNRTITGATVSRYHYAKHEELKKHLSAFLMAYNFASRLKTLNGKSPYEFMRSIWEIEPQRCTVAPNHFNLGLYN